MKYNDFSRLSPPFESVLALQCDPLMTLQRQSDSSLFLAYEAQKRGMSVFVYTPNDLSLAVQDGRVTPMARGVFVHLEDTGRHYHVMSHALVPLHSVQALLIRQDPPFDTRYMSNLYLLDTLRAFFDVCMVNAPQGIRETCEKTVPFLWPQYMPDTLVSDVVDDAYAFAQNYDSIIIKPLLGHGGRGVLRLEKPTRAFLESLMPLYQKNDTGPVVMQRYLHEVQQGDKRVLMVDGRIVCAFRRQPQPLDPRANLVMGGTAIVCDLSAREVEICTHIGPYLKEKGLYLAGVDLLGEHLIEVNVTSPTGLRTAYDLYHLDIPALFWDGLSTVFS